MIMVVMIDYGGDEENIHQVSVIDSRVEKIRCRSSILKDWPWIQELLKDTSRTDMSVVTFGKEKNL